MGMIDLQMADIFEYFDEILRKLLFFALVMKYSLWGDDPHLSQKFK